VLKLDAQCGVKWWNFAEVGSSGRWLSHKGTALGRDPCSLMKLVPTTVGCYKS
jgi:hypothetical protein